MATISFLVNGIATDHSKPAAWVTIEEIDGGSLRFKLKQIGGTMGSLRGLYFDIIDKSIYNTLRVKAIPNNVIRISEDSIKCLRNGTNMDQMLVDTGKSSHSKGEIVQSGIGKDGTHSYSFTLCSTARELTLCDFFHIQLDYSAGCVADTDTTNDDDSHRWLYMSLL